MGEQRKDIRTGVAIVLKIAWPDKEIREAASLNYSHGGVLTNNPFDEIPPIGTPMTVQVTTLVKGKAAPVLPVVVVRASQNDLAFQFI